MIVLEKKSNNNNKIVFFLWPGSFSSNPPYTCIPTKSETGSTSGVDQIHCRRHRRSRRRAWIFHQSWNIKFP